MVRDRMPGTVRRRYRPFFLPARWTSPKRRCGKFTPLGALLGDLSRKGVRSVAPTGALRNPTGANAQDGGEVLHAMADGAARRIRHDTRNRTGCLIDPDAGGA
jgi:hypothetical protein